MTVRTVSEICCERCGTAERLPKSAVGRNSKPVGWSRVSISAKVVEGKPVQVIASMDVCPSCVAAISECLGCGSIA